MRPRTSNSTCASPSSGPNWVPLRNDATLYQKSLDSALRWIDEHLDGESPAVRSLRTEVDALLRFDVDAAMPDVSESLARLREVAPAALTPSPEPP